MSATDALTDLAAARLRIREELDIEEARPHGGSVMQRVRLNEALRAVDVARLRLQKYVEDRRGGL